MAVWQHTVRAFICQLPSALMAERRQRQVKVPDSPAIIPIKPAAVAKKPTLAMKRAEINKLMASRSEALVKRFEGLTAAAQVLTASPASVQVGQPNAATRTWQQTAFSFARCTPELGAGKMYVGNAMSRVRLKVGKRGPDGTVEDSMNGDEPVEGITQDLIDEASAIISEFRGDVGGQSELIRRYGENMFLVGEGYVLPKVAPWGTTYEFLSVQELARSGNGWVRYRGPSQSSEDLPPGTEPLRIHRPDSQYAWAATSSVQSCLEILEELAVMTRHVRASTISRMSVAGVLLLPDELDNPIDDEAEDGQTAEAMNPLAYDFINTASKAIDDPASAAAYTPYVIQGPQEVLAGVRHIAFQAQGAENIVLRREAQERLAQGLDLPVEVLLGFAGTTFANATVIDANTWKVHIEPSIVMLADALTIAMLWPRMALNRGLDPDRVKEVGYPDDVLSVAVYWDASDLISRPDHTANVIELYTKDPSRSAVTRSEVRDAVGLDPTQTVADDEWSKRIDAERLTKIREVIPAPPSDAATSLEDAGGAVVPGASGAAKALDSNQTIDDSGALLASGARATLAQRVAGAAEMTVERAAERIGAKLRSKMRGAERTAVEGVGNADLAAHLGPQAVLALLDGDDPAAAEMEVFRRMVQRWATACAHPSPRQVSDEARDMVVRASRDRLYGDQRDIEPALTALISGD